MVRQYAEEYYKPSAALYRYLSENSLARARALAKSRARVRERWPQVKIRNIQHTKQGLDGLSVGSQLKVEAELDLAGLDPEEVLVEIYHGLVDPKREFQNGHKTPMSVASSSRGDRLYTFEGTIPCEQSGLYGYSVRVMPKHPDLAEPRNMGLVHWAPG
jgi:starch phosphorylase